MYYWDQTNNLDWICSPVVRAFHYFLVVELFGIFLPAVSKKVYLSFPPIVISNGSSGGNFYHSGQGKGITMASAHIVPPAISHSQSLREMLRDQIMYHKIQLRIMLSSTFTVQKMAPYSNKVDLIT